MHKGTLICNLIELRLDCKRYGKTNKLLYNYTWNILLPLLTQQVCFSRRIFPKTVSDAVQFEALLYQHRVLDERRMVSGAHPNKQTAS